MGDLSADLDGVAGEPRCGRDLECSCEGVTGLGWRRTDGCAARDDEDGEGTDGPATAESSAKWTLELILLPDARAAGATTGAAPFAFIRPNEGALGSESETDRRGKDGWGSAPDLRLGPGAAGGGGEEGAGSFVPGRAGAEWSDMSQRHSSLLREEEWAARAWGGHAGGSVKSDRGTANYG